MPFHEPKNEASRIARGKSSNNLTWINSASSHKSSCSAYFILRT